MRASGPALFQNRISDANEEQFPLPTEEENEPGQDGHDVEAAFEYCSAGHEVQAEFDRKFELQLRMS